MLTTLNQSSLKFSELKTYAVAALFIIGNIVMPQMFHALPGGGHIWLPIYFFTLVGAYIYGWRVGVLTAVASPVVNSLLFGMPAVSALDIIVIKSLSLAAIAGYVASRGNKATLLTLIAVVAGYQATGTAAQWLLHGSLHTAINETLTGVPGMLFQIVAGTLAINLLKKN